MSLILEWISAFIVLLSFIGLGSFVIRSRQLCEQALTGAGIYAFVVSLLGPFVSISFLSWTLLLPGLVLGVYQIHQGRHEVFQSRLPLIVLGYLGISLFLASYASPYLDPLNYHLFGIVEWMKVDRLVHRPAFTQIMHNSFADYLYFPFAVIFGTEDTSGLRSLQTSAQIMTVFLGIGCFSILLGQLLEKKVDKIWLGLFILAALTRASLQHKGLIAKNDWIALSWFLLGFRLITENERNKKLPLVGAFVMGVSIGTKLSFALPLLILTPLFFTISLRRLVLPVMVIALTMIPYLARNYFWTENPFFPLGHKLFPTEYLGPSWIEGMAFFDYGLSEISFNALAQKLSRVFTYEPVVYFSLILPFLLKKDQRSFRITIFLSFMFLILFVFFMGPNSEVRHFGPLAVGMNLMGVLGASRLCKLLNLNQKLQKVVVATFIFCIFFNILTLPNQLHPIPSSLRKGHFLPREQSLIEEKRGLTLADKIAGMPSYSSAKFALIDDTPPYFFSLFNVIRLWDDPEIDRNLDRCKDLVCVLAVLDARKIDYLIESQTYFDPYYRPGVQEGILKLRDMLPNSIVLSIDGVNLISVKELKSAIVNEF